MEFRHAASISGFAGPVRSLCIGAGGRLYVSDGANIRSYDSPGRPAASYTASRPVCAVAVASNGSVYAGEAGQVEIFDGSGRIVGTWRNLGALGEITAIGFFGRDVFLGDAAGRCILRCDRAGRVLGRIGANGPLGGFHIPNGIIDFDIDAEGVIHAANPGKHRVERYSRDGELLGHVGRFDGQDPAGFGGCCNPTNAALGHSGRIYVTEKADARAKVLDRNGKLLAVIGEGMFHPASKNMTIAIDTRGCVYVADAARRRVVIFEEVAA